jgi:hypothetical protein
MSSTCKQWFDNIGCNVNNLDKFQYTNLVWCAALASKVENITSTNSAMVEIPPSCNKCILFDGCVARRESDVCLSTLMSALRQ